MDSIKEFEVPFKVDEDYLSLKIDDFWRDVKYSAEGKGFYLGNRLIDVRNDEFYEKIEVNDLINTQILSNSFWQFKLNESDNFVYVFNLNLKREFVDIYNISSLNGSIHFEYSAGLSKVSLKDNYYLLGIDSPILEGDFFLIKKLDSQILQLYKFPKGDDHLLKRIKSKVDHNIYNTWRRTGQEGDSLKINFMENRKLRTLKDIITFEKNKKLSIYDFNYNKSTEYDFTIGLNTEFISVQCESQLLLQVLNLTQDTLKVKSFYRNAYECGDNIMTYVRESPASPRVR